ncbi:TfoX/Sxy family protein [bacterium]|nr:TfoX/Sxy family protein [bacterium]
MNPDPLIKLIGPVTAGRLHTIGVHTREDIESLGSVEIYLRLKERFGNNVTLNALYGIEAIIRNINWLELSQEVKAKLKKEVQRSLRS